MAIRNDAERWSRLGVFDSVFKREKIGSAISRHRDRLNDCISTFHVSACWISLLNPRIGGTDITTQTVAAIKMANYVDQADASTVPGAPTLTTAQTGEAPQETIDDAVRNLLLPTVVLLYNTNRFL
jgi:hypothetical protein